MSDAEGYKGHRAGSNKGKVHKAFDDAGKGDKGKAAALKLGTRLKLEESTIRTWCSQWAKGSAAKKTDTKKTAKKAAPAKKTAKKAAPKKAAKRERITEASASA